MGFNSKFIVNDEKTLAEVLNNIIPSSNELDFLVGYFYFSGFKEIYQQIQDQRIRILIGLDVEQQVQKEIVEINELRMRESNFSDKEIKEKTINGYVQLLGHVAYFDTSEFTQAWNVFCEKIINGTLEIRKTRDPNHAKLYIFTNKPEHSQSGEFLGTVITGSSNLSISGLKNRNELDVVLRDSNDYEDAKKIFEEIWKNSVIITNGGEEDFFVKAINEKTWLGGIKTPSTPYLMYVRVLDEYFKLRETGDIQLPFKITRGQYVNLSYQEDAIKQGLDIIKNNNGVLLSDVVGTGKSIIASAIAYNLEFHPKVIILCRPHLMTNWEAYASQFNLNAKIVSSGNLKEAISIDKNFKATIVLVDEAHQFRNDAVESYSLLHQLCQGKRVILLTATPFNNRPEDVFNLIKLFQIPSKSTLSSSLEHKFKQLSKRYKDLRVKQSAGKIKKEELDLDAEDIAKEIRSLIAPVTVRRSRDDLREIKRYREDLIKKGYEMSEIEPPIEFNYDLGSLAEKYQSTLEQILQFKGVRYKTVSYVEKEKLGILANEFGEEGLVLLKQGQINLADFMKRLLVSRFESSIEAFRSSLQNLISSSQLILNWYEQMKMVPIYKKADLPDPEAYIETEDEIDDTTIAHDIPLLEKTNPQLDSLKQKGIRFISDDYLMENFESDLNSDIKLLKEILDNWKDVKDDYKLTALESKIHELLQENPKRKVIVFSQYADTVNYLGDRLKNNTNFRTISYTAQNSNLRNIIETDFDAGLPINEQTNNYDVLVATDALSEGVNLHRAGIVINYDIPYNPMRVVQRIGRIDRINKKQFDKLYIYNSFPSDIGSGVINVRGITTLKMRLVSYILGLDTQVLTDKDVLVNFYNDFNKRQKETNEKSWDVDYRNEYDDICANKPEILEQARALPLRSRLAIKSKDKYGVIVFGKKGENCIFKFSSNPKEQKELIDQDGIGIFFANKDVKSLPASADFQIIYKPLIDNLFQGDIFSENPISRNKALTKIRAALPVLPSEEEYLFKLEQVINKFGALTTYEYKQINDLIDEDKPLDVSVQKLKNEIPLKYLQDIIDRGESIDEQEETIILSEEMIQ